MDWGFLWGGAGEVLGHVKILMDIRSSDGNFRMFNSFLYLVLTPMQILRYAVRQFNCGK